MAYAEVHSVGDFNGDGYKDFAVAGDNIGFLMNFGGNNLQQETLLEDAPLQFIHSNGIIFARSVLRDVDLDDGFDDLVFSIW